MLGRSGLGLDFLLVAALSVVVAVDPTEAALPMAFPTDQRLVPVAVGAAFALPAVLALACATLLRIGRRLGSIGGVAALAIMSLALAGILQSGLF